jgi:hypothetical protein
VPEPIAQQILAELNSLVPPTASTSTQPPPGIDQAVIDQVSCQVQTGGPAPGTQVQSATQTSTTVQLIDLSSGSQPTSVDQTEQQTWQLQIGCLLYCTETQQVQQAQQAITTIHVLVGQPGSPTSSTTGAAGTVSQVIWQLQIGCIAWCYDATQVQDATSETTVIVITPVPPTSGPPAQTPPPTQTPPPAATTGDPPRPPADAPPAPAPVEAPAGPAPADAPAATASTPATVGPAVTATLLLRSTARAGVAVLERRPIAPAVAAPATVRSEVLVSTVSLPASGSAPFRGSHASPAPGAFRARAGRPSSTRPPRDPRAAPGAAPARTALLAAVAAQPDSTPTLLFIAFGLAAALALWAFRGGRPTRPGR